MARVVDTGQPRRVAADKTKWATGPHRRSPSVTFHSLLAKRGQTWMALWTGALPVTPHPRCLAGEAMMACRVPPPPPISAAAGQPDGRQRRVGVCTGRRRGGRYNTPPWRFCVGVGTWQVSAAFLLAVVSRHRSANWNRVIHDLVYHDILIQGKIQYEETLLLHLCILNFSFCIADRHHSPCIFSVPAVRSGPTD